MPDYSLVPVDYQPDFDDYSLVPVDHDPFAADGVAQQSQIQQAQAEPQGPPQQQPGKEPANPIPLRRLRHQQTLLRQGVS